MRAGLSAYIRLLAFTLVIAIITTFLVVAVAVMFRNGTDPYIGSDWWLVFYLLCTIVVATGISYAIYGKLMEEKIHWAF